MIGLTPSLGLFCIILSASLTTLVAPAPIIQEDIVRHVHLAERSSSFNTRQKWQRDEINCIQILNPAAGANYHPGWFVRMNYGASQCQGVTATGPWTIHLYNNPEIQQGGNVRFDYHEVIVDGLNEYKTQYVWNIPADHTVKAMNVKKLNDYYVRVETSSQQGIKLVGNVGPFSITAEGPMGGLKSLTQDLPELKRREELPQDLSQSQPDQGPDSNFHAEFALRPKPAVIQPPDVAKDGTPVLTKDESGQATNPEAHTVSQDPDVYPEATKNPAFTPVAPVMPIVDRTAASTVVAPVMPENDDTSVVPEPHNLPLPPNGNTEVVSDPNAPLPHNLPPSQADNDPPATVTPISHGSLIPNKFLVGGSVLAGALGLGYLGGVGLGQLGAVLGALLGGVVGGVAAVLSLTGLPV